MKFRELLDAGAELLRNAGVPEAKHDAREILLNTFGMTLGQYVYYQETAPEHAFPDRRESITASEDSFFEKIRRRAKREPLQQILGEGFFMGLSFEVNAHTLSPRPDTEILVEEVLRDIGEQGTNVRLLDMCTGTGCIGISIAVYARLSDTVLSDISDEALSVAGRNAERLCPGGRIRTVKSDLFAAFSGETFDVITANPPYIEDAVIETLEPEVKDYEPRLALSGGEDGLSFYRRIVSEAPKYTKNLYLEIGYNQAQPVSRLMQEAGFTDIRVVKDLGENDRVVIGHIV